MSFEPISERVPRQVNKPHQFSFENGMVITHAEPGLVRGELTVTENSYNPPGIVHGGAQTTLADTAAGCCACSKGGHCVTSNCTMEFLRPATGKKIYCVATPKKMGRSLSTIQVSLTNDEGVEVATGTFTFFMLDV